MAKVQRNFSRMEKPTLEISPGESVTKVAARLAGLYRQMGTELLEIEVEGQSDPHAIGFFQAHVDSQERMLVVVTKEWTHPVQLMIMDILLQLQADPSPPGSTLRFEFHSAHPVPPLFLTFFGGYRISRAESQAAMAVGFGVELQGKKCLQLAALVVHLLGTLGVRTGFEDPNGIRLISEFVDREIRSLNLPRDGTPLNLLICLGCFYGELIRSRLPCAAEWLRVKDHPPWPCLVIRKKGVEEGSTGQHLGFNPISLVIQFSQGSEKGFLEKSGNSLLQRCSKT